MTRSARAMAILALAAAPLGLVTAVAATPAATAPLNLEADFAKADATHASVTDSLDIGGVKLPVVIDTTTQGNGTLKIGNLLLRLMDRHDDGLVYAGSGVLKLDVVALSPGQRATALVISGVALRSGDKESDPVVPEAVLDLYALDCTAGKFIRVWHNAAVDVAIDTNAGGKIRCAK